MSYQPLITAAEGYPALERLAASAQDELILSFRSLAPETRLREPALRERGLQTWADLIAWVSRRGVKIRMLLTDFDPLFTSDLHRQSWACASGFADVVQGDAQILCAPHGQRAGPLWKILMGGKVRTFLSALRAEDTTRLTPLQRDLLKKGPVLRPATIHQKFAIADAKACIIGGLDVHERFYDDHDHQRPPEETWHDISVLIEDTDFAGALRGHFADCWNAALDCGAKSLAERASPIKITARAQSRADLRLIRTFSAPCGGVARLAPRTVVADHEKTLIKLFSEAKRSIYIETQYLRHAPLVDALCRGAEAAPDLQVIVVLPAAPDRVLFEGDYGWDARHAHGLQITALDRLNNSFGDRLSLLTSAQNERAPSDGPSVRGAGPIYLHSKIAIVDQRHVVIGSANLNGRSMRWDSEASALIKDADFAKDLFQKLASYWMGKALPALESQSMEQAQVWTDVARADADRAPQDRLGQLLPFPIEAGQKFSRRVPFLPNDMF